MLAVLALPAPALADVGVGVGASPITLAQPALPGHTYELPPLLVVNTGTEQSTIVLQVRPAGGAAEQPVPSSWIAFGKNGFALAAKATMAVAVTLAVPAGASGGAYRSDVLVSLGRADAPGVGLGVGALARLSFSVDGPPPTPTAQPTPPPVPTVVAAAPPPQGSEAPRWLYAAAGAILVVLAGAAARRLPLRLRLRRRAGK